MPDPENIEDQINAEPTKEFFVDMITRDIQLEQAVLDLVDNSVDGAKRFRSGHANRLEGFEVKIEVSATSFSITDNCGGFDKASARNYAFRFGRPAGRAASPNSIGQFGVGMKRALFKFGRHFTVESAGETEKWAVDVDVTAWESIKEWTFPWAEFSENSPVAQTSGTRIVVDRLRPEVSARFGTEHFVNGIIGLIKSKHRQFIAEGLAISINGRHITATSLCVLENVRHGAPQLGRCLSERHATLEQERS